MVIIDANAILRIILSDDAPMEKEVKNLIRQNPVLIRNEVMAEIVYVLMKVYKVSKAEVCQCLLNLIKVSNIYLESEKIVLCALQTFESNNIDFVDSLLCAYHFIDDLEIFTFDKKIKKLIEK